jgi:CheY-like chemotaxis protein
LRQIVTILVDNAIKFSDPSGRVDVSVEDDGPTVVITVRDEGRGIAPERLPQLFEGFVQGRRASSRREGSLGFGLPIAHTLAGLHGGSLAAHSAGPGRGATFTVRLPIADALPAEPAAEEEATGPVSLTGIRVLGVDDDPESREVLAMALLSYQATVTVAASAADAFEQLRIEVPDVIVSDIAMPEVDGYAFVERLRSAADARVRALPIIALTAYASPRDRAEALRRGFSSYVAKPYEGADLARLIAEVMARHVSTSC